MDDEAYFIFDKIYTVDQIGMDHFNNEEIVYVAGVEELFAWESQLKLVVEDNAINRLLYPEYKIVNGYLEEDDV